MDNNNACYGCRHRRDIPGDAHSRCVHPDLGGNDPLKELAGLLDIASGDMSLATKMGVRLDAHGVLNGWANWPYNFDPIWIKCCEKFEKLK